MKKIQKGKRLLVILVCILSISSLVSCNQNSSTTTTQETQTNTTSTEIPEKDTVYGIGDTWTVDGQWSLTINSVTATNDRNEFSDKTPAAVYMIDYTYTNIGYEDPYEASDGLFLSLELGSVVDSAGIMGYSYPGGVTNYPQAAPVGATCNAQACIGVDNAGSFTLNVSQYDGNSEKQSAKFNLTVE